MYTPTNSHTHANVHFYLCIISNHNAFAADARAEDYAKPNVSSNLDEFPTASISFMGLEREWSSMVTQMLYTRLPVMGFSEWSPVKVIFRFN